MDTGRSTIDVLSVEVSTLAHATEDEDKVERAVRNLLPEGLGEGRLKWQRLSGYHKDPLTLITIKLKKRKGATQALMHTIDLLSPLDRERLLEEIEERVDKSGNLYLRLDKQKALKGRGALVEVDSIRMKFGIRVPHGRLPIEYIKTVVESFIEKDATDPDVEKE